MVTCDFLRILSPAKICGFFGLFTFRINEAGILLKRFFASPAIPRQSKFTHHDGARRF